MTAAQSSLALVWPDMAEGLGAAAVLIGSRCPACDRHDFPAAELCPECGAHKQRIPLGREGHIHSLTTVRTRPPYDLPAPYSVAYVDLTDVPLRVFALLAPDAGDRLDIGDRVVMTVIPLGSDGAGQPCLRPVFGLPENADTQKDIRS